MVQNAAAKGRGGALWTDVGLDLILSAATVGSNTAAGSGGAFFVGDAAADPWVRAGAAPGADGWRGVSFQQGCVGGCAAGLRGTGYRAAPRPPPEKTRDHACPCAYATYTGPLTSNTA